MSDKKRLVPYLKAPVYNLSRLAEKLHERCFKVAQSNWFGANDLEELQDYRNEMLEELIELDALLDKMGKILEAENS